jgi:uncharacterized membrane protein YhaH (DUF805 family)
MINHDGLKNIEKLHEMKGAGILSEEEFEDAKKKLLSGTKPVSARSVAKPSPLERPRDDDYVAWALLPLRRYAEFTGRSSRKEFWFFFLGINMAVAALMFLWQLNSEVGATGPIGTMAILTTMLGLLGLVVPYIAAQVRRLHDQGKSGLFALLNLIPYVGGFIMLGFMLVESTPGDNEYGPNPLA